MAISIDTMEIKDMPMAVLKARFSAICRDRMKVSSAIEVRIPFIMAKAMIASVGHGIPVN